MRIYALIGLIGTLLFAGLGAQQLPAQTVPALTVQEVLSRNINGTREQQMRPIPHRIIGNLYYVGSETLSSFLVATPEGHILINSTFERNVPLIRQSVERLGFNFEDIEILLASHGHTDHVEGDAMVKELTGAEVIMMAEDVPGVERITPGGKPHPVDGTLRHLDEVSLGGTTLVAHLTPAHTPGCTTWTMTMEAGGENYNVMILGCGFGTGSLVDEDGRMTDPVDQYIASLKYLRNIPCDVFLAAHGPQYNLMPKYANVGRTPNPFIDPEGCRNELDNWGKLLIARIGQQVEAALSQTPE